MSYKTIVFLKVVFILFIKLDGLSVCFQSGVTRITKVVKEAAQVNSHVIDLFRRVTTYLWVYFPCFRFKVVQSLSFDASAAHFLDLTLDQSVCERINSQKKLKKSKNSLLLVFNQLFVS